MQNANTLGSVMVLLKNLPEILNTPLSKVGRVSQSIINESDDKSKSGSRNTKKNPNAKAGVRPFTLEGQIMRGNRGAFSVAGEDFVISNDTWIFGDVVVGALATVHGVTKNGERIARKIVVTQPAK